MKRISAILFILIFAMLFSLVSCDEIGKQKVKSEFIFMVEGVEYARLESGTPEDPQKEGYVFDGWYLDEGTWEHPLFTNSLVFKPVEGAEGNYVVDFDGSYNIIGGSAGNVVIVSPGGSKVEAEGDFVFYESVHYDIQFGESFAAGQVIQMTSMSGTVYVYAKFITEAEAAERQEKEDSKEKEENKEDEKVESEASDETAGE